MNSDIHEAKDALTRVCFTSFRPGQQEILEAVLAVGLTGTGRAVLKGEEPLTLRGDVLLSRGRETEMRRTLEEIEVAQAEDLVSPSEAFTPVQSGGETAPLTANQNRLLAALKAKRLDIAREQKQPAFIIFHDKVLIEMARRRPKTREDMCTIPGIGPDKIARFGLIFLAVIANHNDL